LQQPDAVNLPRQVGARTLVSSFPASEDPCTPRDDGAPVEEVLVRPYVPSYVQGEA